MESAYKQIKLNSERDFIYDKIRGLSLFGARNVLKKSGAEHDQFQEEAGRMRDINDKSAAIKKINVEKEYLKTRNFYPMQIFNLLPFCKKISRQSASTRNLSFSKPVFLKNRPKSLSTMRI